MQAAFGRFHHRATVYKQKKEKGFTGPSRGDVAIEINRRLMQTSTVIA